MTITSPLWLATMFATVSFYWLLPATQRRHFLVLVTAVFLVAADYRAFLLLCLFTASRRGNVASMEWAELDLENAVWHIPATKTKNKRPTSISLCAPALAILTAPGRRPHRLA